MYKNLKAEMVRAGITQRQMAERIQISRQSFGYKMVEQNEWKLAEMQKIQEILNKELGKELTLDYLFECENKEG